MATFNIKTQDAATGQPVLADIYLLDSDGGSPILSGGVPVAMQTDVNGNYQFNNAMAQVYARVQATGYTSQNVTLVPGNNVIKLDGVGGPTAVIASTRTFYNKFKTIIWLVLIVLAVILGVKYKIIPL